MATQESRLKSALSLIAQDVKDLTSATDALRLPPPNGVDDTAVIQDAIDAANFAEGGVIDGGGREYLVTGILARSYVTIQNIKLYLIEDSNKDVILGHDTLSLIDSGNNSANVGVYRFALINVEINGNSDGQVDTSNGIRLWGRDFTFLNVNIHDCRDNGLWTEWGQFGDVPNAMESSYVGMKIHRNGAWGWRNRGPHDSTGSNIQVFTNGMNAALSTGGVWFEDSPDNLYSAGGCQFTNFHVWGQSHRWGCVADSTVYIDNAQFEGAGKGNLLVRSNSVIKGRIFTVGGQNVAAQGVQIGDDGQTEGLADLKVVGVGGFDLDLQISGFSSASRSSSALAWVNANTGRARILITPLHATVAGDSVDADIYGWVNQTLNVESAVGWPFVGTLSTVTTGGIMRLSYTGRTETSFTGVETLDGGYGALTTDNVIAGDVPVYGDLDYQSDYELIALAGSSETHRAYYSTSRKHGAAVQEIGGLFGAFTIKSNQTDLFNINGGGKRIESTEGMLTRAYKDSYGTPTYELDGADGSIRPGTESGVGGRIYSGSGTPSFYADTGSFYFRDDGLTKAQRLYVNNSVGGAGVSWITVVSEWEPKEVLFGMSGVLITKVGDVPWIADGSYTIVSARAGLTTAPTGSTAIVDLKKNGDSIYGTPGNRPTFAVASKSATVGTHSVTTLVSGNQLTCDVSQIGSTVAGAGLGVVITLQRTA